VTLFFWLEKIMQEGGFYVFVDDVDVIGSSKVSDGISFDFFYSQCYKEDVKP
jgi:hypothetical protein